MTDNIVKHSFDVTRSHKEKLTGTKGLVLWLTGLSGSGKSTIANELENLLMTDKLGCKILDGDSVRQGLCSNLSFSQEDRYENLRRVAEVSKLFVENAAITICCFIAPLEEQRSMIKNILGNDFHLIYISTSIEECEARDPKGLYKKARSGEIKNFTGISSDYDIPESPALTVDTRDKSAKECALEIYNYYLSTTK